MRRPRRRSDRTGWGTDARPVCARAIIPGRARNSIHTAAAMAPNSVKRKRLRAKPSDEFVRASAMSSDTVTPTANPKMPERTLAPTERRTPRTRPTKIPAKIAKTNAGTRSQRSPPSRSKTDSASVGVIAARAARASRELLDDQLPVGEACPEHLLVELADARLRHLFDERPTLGELPARDARIEELAEVVRAHVRAALQHDARERPLRPLRVGNRDDGGLDHLRMGHQVDLELYGGDPLPARLDHVLRAVGDLDETVRRDARDVAGAEPAVLELLGI